MGFPQYSVLFLKTLMIFANSTMLSVKRGNSVSLQKFGVIFSQILQILHLGPPFCLKIMLFMQILHEIIDSVLNFF